MNRRELIRKILQRLRIDAGCNGYAYMKKALEIRLDSYKPTLAIIQDVYIPIAEFYKIKQGSVERCLRHVVHKCFNDASDETIIEIFGTNEPCTTKTFIETVAEYIALCEEKNNENFT